MSTDLFMWIAGPPAQGCRVGFSGDDIVVDSTDGYHSVWTDGVKLFGAPCDMTNSTDWDVAIIVRMDLYAEDSTQPTIGAKLLASRSLAEKKAAFSARLSDVLSNRTDLGNIAMDLALLKLDHLKLTYVEGDVSNVKARLNAMRGALGIAPADTMVKSETWVVSSEAWTHWVREIFPMYLDHPHYQMSALLIVDKGGSP